jgi:hypothetical protein
LETKGEAMEHKNKFAAETVLKLQQSLAEVPPYEASELSKQQTIDKLSPHILALRSKGYSWTAVAAMLSERGLPVSVAALRTYLRRVREEPADEKPRTQAKRSRDARAQSPQAQSLPENMSSPSQSSETSSARKPQEPAAESAPAVALQNASTTGTRREPEPRPSGFTVRPDRKDI